jgi:hypothetical protein
VQYTGYFINLDRATERRATLEAHLASRYPAHPYHRFPAVDGAARGFTSDHISAGNIGCYHSHRAVLRQHLDGARHLHIIEDDTRMAKNAPWFIDRAIETGMLDQFDILFTDTVLPPIFAGAKEFRRKYRDGIGRDADGAATSIDFTMIKYAAGTNSCLVNRASIRRLHDLLDEELQRGPEVPIDLRIRDWRDQGILRVACLFPFITTVRVGEFDSAIDDERVPKLSRLAIDLLRYSYFVECDMLAVRALAGRYLVLPPPTDQQESLHVRLAGFIASDGFDTL